MRRVVGLSDAAAYTNLSVWELRTGALAGKYPHMRVGGERGRFVFDLDLLDAAIEQIMLKNTQPAEPVEQYGRIRAVR